MHQSSSVLTFQLIIIQNIHITICEIDLSTLLIQTQLENFTILNLPCFQMSSLFIYNIQIRIIMGNCQSQNFANSLKQRSYKKTSTQVDRARLLINNLGLREEQILKICSLNVTQLIYLLNSRSLTSLNIVLSLVSRTSTIGRKYNLFTQTNFEYAIETAIKSDNMRWKLKKNNWTFQSGPMDPIIHFPPLFGIPISVKQTFNMEGFITSVGLQDRIHSISENQSPIITCIINSGMIPFIRSNVPQLGSSPQTNNKIWGRSLNPWDKTRTVGGSSGGQGGLISSRCSFLGMGSDVAGSLRIPAQFCGVFSIKPYSKRYPSSYHSKYSKAFSGSNMVIPLSIGPFARSAQDLAYFMKVTLLQQFYEKKCDPFVKKVQFKNQSYLSYKNSGRKMKIGYLTSFKDIEPSPASRNVVNEVKDLLKKMGHQLIEVKIPNQIQIIKSFLRQNLSTKGRNFRQILNGEEPVDQYSEFFLLAQMPNLLVKIGKILGGLFLQREIDYILQSCQQMSAYEYQTHVGSIQDYKYEWINYWKEKEIQFLITPGFGCQAFKHGMCQDSILACSYTFVWNVLDMSVGSMPVRTVKDSEQYYQSIYNDRFAKTLEKSAIKSAGLPVGIQVVGLPYDQEKILGFMSMLEEHIQFYKNNPLPHLE